MRDTRDRARRGCRFLVVAILTGFALGSAATEDGATRGESARHDSADQATPEPSSPEPQGSDSPAVAGEAAPSELVVYVPPSRGAARVRVGGGTRGVETGRARQLEALAPDHVGLTLREQPTLAWFVSGAEDARIDFTLIREDSAEPVAERTLTGPFPTGVRLLQLSDLGVRLEPETVYEWSLVVVLDPAQRDRDLYSGGALRLASGPDRMLLQGEPHSVAALARGGIWYDAITVLSEAIAERPLDPTLRAQRAALLDQAGLEHAAAHDRRRREEGAAWP